MARDTHTSQRNQTFFFAHSCRMSLDTHVLPPGQSRAVLGFLWDREEEEHDRA
jgi:hypothetical protein